MLAQLGLAKNPALARIGSIVHFLEARGTPVPEAAGVQTLLQGAVRRSPNEDELLARGGEDLRPALRGLLRAPRRRQTS